MIGGLAKRALDLLVALMAHQDDVVVFLREAHGLAVHLGHERAGRVDRGEVAGGGSLVDGRGDAVRGKDDASTLGHLVGLLDEDRAALGQRLDDELVVDDLLAHVHGRAVELEGLFDDVDGAVHAGAVSAGSRQENTAAALAVGGRQGGFGAGTQVDVFIHASTLAPGDALVRALVAIPHAPHRRGRGRPPLPDRPGRGAGPGAPSRSPDRARGAVHRGAARQRGGAIRVAC